MMPDRSQQPTVPLTIQESFPCSFGRYTLIERLGSGGMGTVYRAQDRELQREVALKIPHPNLIRLPEAHERFLHEARAAARLEHPHFCPVYDVGEIEGHPYLSMRYIPSKPLSEVPPREPQAIAHLLRTLARALAHAHSRGVIHRDLKPGNILIDASGTPIITDFGLAVRLDTRDPRLTGPGLIVGTPSYMAPEQVRPDLAPVGPWSDVYSLGVILYELLTGEVPFKGEALTVATCIVTQDVEPPSLRCPDVDPQLEAICLKALSRNVSDRYTSMADLADDLAQYLGVSEMATPWAPISGLVPLPASVEPGLLDHDRVQFRFAGHGEHIPTTVPRDRIFLDVGNALRPGVLDHHHLGGGTGSTASLVLNRPDLVRAVLTPTRQPGEPFTFVLHEQPDLDGVASAYLALELLTKGTFPPGASALARYIDKVDEGSVGMSLANPSSLYAAYYLLGHRLARQEWHAPPELWRALVHQGLDLVAFAMAELSRLSIPLPQVDCFACPGLFGQEDRDMVQADIHRYHAKLRDPATHARWCVLQLPGQFGGKVQVESLRVRNVQNLDDPERVIFFKDWARSDTKLSRLGKGFQALSVFQSEGPRRIRRCILSVKPDCGASLRGLGILLDQAESERRKEIHGVDDRLQDPVTGHRKIPRPGYDNADPWYDGRAHDYTMVDAPRTGTWLSAEEIETLFLQFGGIGGEAKPATDVASEVPW